MLNATHLHSLFYFSSSVFPVQFRKEGVIKGLSTSLGTLDAIVDMVACITIFIQLEV